MKRSVLPMLSVLFLLAACANTNKSPNATAIPPSPTATITPLPTPSSRNDSIVWDHLQVTMDQLEILDRYLTDYGSSRIPPDGQKFLWVHIRITNTGQTQMDFPALEHFSILYADAELKPTYGHRQNYKDYSTLGTVISPAQELDGWLRFDIPSAAELKDLLFIFIPESAQVGASYGSPSYPYAGDKPTYVWNCTP